MTEGNAMVPRMAHNPDDHCVWCNEIPTMPVPLYWIQPNEDIFEIYRAKAWEEGRRVCRGCFKDNCLNGEYGRLPWLEAKE